MVTPRTSHVRWSSTFFFFFFKYRDSLPNSLFWERTVCRVGWPGTGLFIAARLCKWLTCCGIMRGAFWGPEWSYRDGTRSSRGWLKEANERKKKKEERSGGGGRWDNQSSRIQRKYDHYQQDSEHKTNPKWKKSSRMWMWRGDDLSWSGWTDAGMTTHSFSWEAEERPSWSLSLLSTALQPIPRVTHHSSADSSFFFGFFFRSFVSLFGFMVSSCFDSLSVRSFDAISSAVCSIMHMSAVTQQKHHYASVLNLDSENDLLLFSSITTYQPHPIRSQTHSRTQAPSQVIWYLFSGGGSWLAGGGAACAASCRSGILAKSSCSATPMAKARTTILPSLAPHEKTCNQR